ncbi:amino acid ABC transporter permease [Haloarcula nitratireducens]|uniref:Amino acid ABC transporter permease n=1 Tax=Haloarcula nitratireducens TaxID=2487749 RepID=A0AAW4PAB3_9EURY|nr:amino acid ABC transporter permease [Halomicroarcula nitratireducens]MBX0294814.1 amino acid ABC transporter permease [Halomicroarcula nitratireducens]
MLQTGDWTFVLNNLDYLLSGAAVTVGLTVTSLLLGLLVGFPAGAIEVYGDGVGKRLVSLAGVVLRGTPIVVIMLVLFFVVSISKSAFVTATVGLGLRSAAYQSQIFRGALQSVDDGQMEAARSIGMSRLGGIRHVVVPQALRRSMPGFQNEFTIVLKDTSIAFAIGLAELLTRGYDLFTQSGRSTAVLEVFLVISAIYFVLTFTTNRGLDWLSEYYAIPSGENT